MMSLTSMAHNVDHRYASVVSSCANQINQLWLLTNSQIGSWFEPLWGYPVNMRGENRWLDTTTTIADAILADERIVDKMVAVDKVSTTYIHE
jgi:hypothetical protein